MEGRSALVNSRVRKGFLPRTEILKINILRREKKKYMKVLMPSGRNFQANGRRICELFLI